MNSIVHKAPAIFKVDHHHYFIVLSKCGGMSANQLSYKCLAWLCALSNEEQCNYKGYIGAVWDIEFINCDWTSFNNRDPNYLRWDYQEIVFLKGLT